MLKTVLLVLTLGDGGTTHMALSEADSLADCAGRAEAVERILTGAGYTIKTMRCGQTDLEVTPYDHGHTEADMRWHYHVALNGASLEDGFTLRSVEPGTCDAGDDVTAFCAISAQGPVTE